MVFRRPKALPLPLRWKEYWKPGIEGKGLSDGLAASWPPSQVTAERSVPVYLTFGVLLLVWLGLIAFDTVTTVHKRRDPLPSTTYNSTNMEFPRWLVCSVGTTSRPELWNVTGTFREATGRIYRSFRSFDYPLQHPGTVVRASSFNNTLFNEAIKTGYRSNDNTDYDGRFDSDFAACVSIGDGGGIGSLGPLSEGSAIFTIGFNNDASIGRNKTLLGLFVDPRKAAEKGEYTSTDRVNVDGDVGASQYRVGNSYTTQLSLQQFEFLRTKGGVLDGFSVSRVSRTFYSTLDTLQQYDPTKNSITVEFSVNPTGVTTIKDQDPVKVLTLIANSYSYLAYCLGAFALIFSARKTQHLRQLEADNIQRIAKKECLALLGQHRGLEAQEPGLKH